MPSESPGPPVHVLITNKKGHWAGEATMVAALARGLAGREHRVSLATHSAARIIERLNGSGVEIVELSLKTRKPDMAWTLTGDMRKLASYVRSEGVDVVHCNASFDTWTAALARRLYGLRVPLIRTKHNAKRIREHRANRWYYGRGIDHVVCPSRAVEEMLRESPLVSNDKIHRIPYGIARKGSGSLERETGLEPATTTLATWSSTTELLALEPYGCVSAPPASSPGSARLEAFDIGQVAERAGGVAGVEDARGQLADPGVVDRRVVGRDHHQVGLA